MTARQPRARNLRVRLAELESRAGAAHAVLDRIPTGCILLDAAGRILTLNTVASAILGLNDGLGVFRLELTTARAADASSLRGLLRDAAQADTAADRGFTGFMTLSRPSQRRPFQILVASLRIEESQHWPQSVAVAIFITDPEARATLRPAALSKMFALTAAEARLAAALTDGLSLDEAAVAFEVTRNTVRSQLRSIFAKTGTRRQGELLRFLWSSPARLMHD